MLVYLDDGINQAKEVIWLSIDPGLFLLVGSIAQFLARLEVRDVLASQRNGFTRLRVAAGAFAALADPEGPETAKLHLFVSAKSRDDAFQDNLNDLVRLFPRDISGIGNRCSDPLARQATADVRSE